MKKPSEIFEGENSSLRKTSVTSQDPILQLKREHEILVYTILDLTVPKADLLKLIRSVDPLESSSAIVHHHRILSALKKFISGE